MAFVGVLSNLVSKLRSGCHNELLQYLLRVPQCIRYCQRRGTYEGYSVLCEV